MTFYVFLWRCQVRVKPNDISLTKTAICHNPQTWTLLQETENTDPQQNNSKACCVSWKYTNRQFFSWTYFDRKRVCNPSCLSNAGIWVLWIVWVMTNCCLMGSKFGKVHSITWNIHSVHKTVSWSVWYYKDIILYKNSCLSLIPAVLLIY
jgi:hypothetical protein